MVRLKRRQYECCRPSCVALTAFLAAMGCTSNTIALHNPTDWLACTLSVDLSAQAHALSALIHACSGVEQVNVPEAHVSELQGREADLHNALYDLLQNHHKVGASLEYCNC